MVYEYRTKGLFKVSAQIAGEECARLENSAEGLSPKTLLDASRDKSAPLHNEFEWNDGLAAEKYRESQAGDIIRNIYIVPQETEETTAVRAFVKVNSGVMPGKYNNIHAVLKNPDARERLLESAKKDCESFVHKYQSLNELSETIRAMRAIIWK